MRCCVLPRGAPGPVLCVVVIAAVTTTRRLVDALQRVKLQLYQAEQKAKVFMEQLMESDQDRTRMYQENKHLQANNANQQGVINSMVCLGGGGGDDSRQCEWPAPQPRDLCLRECAGGLAARAAEFVPDARATCRRAGRASDAGAELCWACHGCISRAAAAACGVDVDVDVAPARWCRACDAQECERLRETVKKLELALQFNNRTAAAEGARSRIGPSARVEVVKNRCVWPPQRTLRCARA